MSKIVRHAFVGNWKVLLLLSIFGVTIPFALLYLYYTTVRIETELDNPEEVVYRYRAGKITVRQNT